MPLVKFVSSVHPANAVGSVILNPEKDGTERVLQLGGDPIEMSDAEFNSLRGELNLEVLQEDKTREESSAPSGLDIPAVESVESVEVVPIVTVEPTNPTTQSASGSIDLKTPVQGS